jgi:hypothetical protein
VKSIDRLLTMLCLGMVIPAAYYAATDLDQRAFWFVSGFANATCAAIGIATWRSKEKNA